MHEANIGSRNNRKRRERSEVAGVGQQPPGSREDHVFGSPRPDGDRSDRCDKSARRRSSGICSGGCRIGEKAAGIDGESENRHWHCRSGS